MEDEFVSKTNTKEPTTHAFLYEHHYFRSTFSILSITFLTVVISPLLIINITGQFLQVLFLFYSTDVGNHPLVAFAYDMCYRKTGW